MRTMRGVQAVLTLLLMLLLAAQVLKQAQVQPQPQMQAQVQLLQLVRRTPQHNHPQRRHCVHPFARLRLLSALTR